MDRRHFLSHLSGSAAAAAASVTLGSTLIANADEMKKNRKSAILLWMSGGPSTIDIWDLKPGAPTGGPFKPISTTGNAQICEHMPMMAEQMKHLSIVRSMSTREADHNRGRYYMRTGFVPNPSIEHPSYGSVLSHELMDQRPELEIPPFVAIGGDAGGPGFLGMAWSPFQVDSNGRVRDLGDQKIDTRFQTRQSALMEIENGFIGRTRDLPAAEHRKVLDKTYSLMTSKQKEAFRVEKESAEAKERYGDNGFGQGCLLARRLVEAGVPFVEVDLGGWDNHTNIHATLQDQKLPQLDRAFSALVEDLVQRGMWQDTIVIWMGEFGRTPRINQDAGRDHWARAWSCVVGGGSLKGGLAVGETNSDGTAVETQPYSSEDLMTSVCHGLGISTDKVFTSKNGRPMKIAGGGKLITDLV
jgi:Protein of unknown function (DUF1501)